MFVLQKSFSMKFNFEEIRETIRIQNDKVSIKTLTSAGLDNGIHVVVSPTLMVSGYGNTEDESKESFFHNLKVFVDDIMDLPQTDRDDYLLSLGFKPEPLKNKKFSRSYVDSYGSLQGFDITDKKTEIFEGSL